MKKRNEESGTHARLKRFMGTRRGMAVVMVVLVLTGLMVIAAPFLASMRMSQKQTMNYAWKTRARFIAEGALRHAVARLMDTHEDTERLADEGVITGTPASIDYDDIDELTVDFDGAGSASGVDMADPRGGMGDVRIEDENGKVNINSAPPMLISNLLGVTVLTDDVEEDDDEIPVEDTTPFFADDDPSTIDGLVKIDREYIAYRGKTAEKLTGCMRGFFDIITRSVHQEDALVLDGRGWKIAEHRALANPGAFTRFETPDSIRDVACWSRFDMLVEILCLHRLYLEQLEEFGVDEDTLRGLHFDDDIIDSLKTPEYEEPEMSADEKQWTKQIKKAGLDPDMISKRGLERTAGMLSKLSKKQLDNIKEFQARRAEEQNKRKQERQEKLEKIVPAAFRDIREAFGQAETIISFEGVDAKDLESIRNYITTTSRRPAGWSPPVVLRADVPRVSAKNEENRRVLAVNAQHWFNPGTTVKLTSSGASECALIDRWARAGLVLSADLHESFTANETFVQAAYRHPVNINSASSRVLKAVLTGLQTSRYAPVPQTTLARRGRDFVTPREADALATLICDNRPIENLEAMRPSPSGTRQPSC